MAKSRSNEAMNPVWTRRVNELTKNRRQNRLSRIIHKSAFNAKIKGIPPS